MNACVQARSVAVHLLFNRLVLEPKWLRTAVLALLLKLLLCCVVLGGVIVIVECMARIFIYFHIHIYTHLRHIASYMSALKTSSTDTLQPAL